MPHRHLATLQHTMELRHYWKVIRRRWPFALIPVLVVLAVGMATYQPPPTGYNVGVRFIVGQPPSPGAAEADEQRYYNWLTSEYIVNGLADWSQGNRFAQLVSAELADQGHDIPAGAIQGSLVADNARSQLVVYLTFGDAEQLAVITEAVITVLTEQNADGLPQLGGETAVLVQLDDPIINPNPAGLRSQLDLPLRLAIALATGLGLALLVEYFDPTLRDREDIASLGLGLLAEIPVERKK